MIKIKSLHKKFGDLQVLKGIDLTIEDKEIVSIIGTSGAGKTTLLSIIGTIMNYSSGEVLYDNINVFKLNDRKLSEFRNKNIGFVFQSHKLLPEFTALENVMIPGLIAKQNQKKLKIKAIELLDYLKMKDRSKHRPSELSGGEQQRIAVARALINNPKVILADEPSGNLDSKRKKELHKLFFLLREDMKQSFVIVTHDNSLAKLSDRIIKLDDGKIVS